jgi:hypothetical protein
MGIIVEFKPVQGRAIAPPGMLANRSAEIVIFPGVRIERWEETPPEAPEQQPRKSGRAAAGRSRKRR